MAEPTQTKNEQPEPQPDERPAWARHHLWQIQPVRDIMLIAGVVGLVWLGYKISVVTVPLLLAIMLAYLVEPLVAKITRTKMVGRSFVVSSIIVLITVVLVVPTVVGAGIAIVQGGELIQRIDERTGQVVASVEAPENESKRQAIRRGPGGPSATRSSRQARPMRPHPRSLIRTCPSSSTGASTRCGPT